VSLSFAKVFDFSDAPCNGLHELFHPKVPANTIGSDADVHFEKATNLCDACPYTGEGGACYERWVDSGRPAHDGVWFGLNPRQLRRFKKGKRTESHSQSLGPQTRIVVRQMHSQGWTVAALAQRYKVDFRTIKRIIQED